eukprot:jgi/Mesen1/4276/ME000022S03563
MDVEKQEVEPTQLKLGIPIENLDQMVVKEADVHQIVLSYLVHNCFKETAETFISSTGMKQAAKYSEHIDRKKRICLPIYLCALQGEALKAIELTKDLGGDLLEANPAVHFDLLTVHFVELIRKKKCEEALLFAQQELKPYGRQPKYLEKLQDCLALLAYEEPHTSPVGSLLSPEYRQTVADALNGALLAYAELPSFAPLERLLKHVVALRQRLYQEKGSPGPFCLQSYLSS